MPTTTTTTTTTTSSGVVPVVFPRVTYKPGPPGPICKSGCGKPCLLFCNAPRLLDCLDGGLDFPDPKNPMPPPRPTPTPSNDPLPTGNVDTNAPKLPPPLNRPDPDAVADPADPEQEDDERECAFEFGLPEPT
jgi:hypothetical protein